MKKIGFTLAEILIVLGIIGVIAALTIPTLVSEHKKKVYASTLAVAVSNLENAASAVIMKENIYYLDELPGGTFMDRLEETLSLEDEPVDGYRIGKGGIAYQINVAPSARQDVTEENEIIDNGGKLTVQYATVVIDVNGESKPNIDGRDIFYFILGHDGRLYPEGGKDWALYTGGAENYRETAAGERNAAAYLMFNGYNMDY